LHIWETAIRLDWYTKQDTVALSRSKTPNVEIERPARGFAQAARMRGWASVHDRLNGSIRDEITEYGMCGGRRRKPRLRPAEN
jgi:hypothetical protein